MNSPTLRLLVFSPDGEWLVGAGGTVRGGAAQDDGIVKAWDTKAWRLRAAWTEGFDARVTAAFFVSPDTVASASLKSRAGRGNPSDGTLIRYWNIREKKELEPLHLKAGWAGDYQVADKLVAAYTRSPKSSGVYTVPRLEEKLLLKNCSAPLRFSPDGKTIAAVDGGDPPQIRLYDSANGGLLAVQKLDAPKDGNLHPRIRSAEFSPDGKKIAVGTIDPIKIYVFAAGLSDIIFTLEPNGMYPDCVKFTPDSEMIALKKDSNIVQLYSLETKKSAKSFGENPDGAYAWCFSPDGNWIAIASGGDLGGSGKVPASKVRVFEVKTGKLVAELD